MFLYLIAILAVAIVYYIRNKYSYWDNVGIPNIAPKIPYGNLESVVKKQRSFGTAIFDLYNRSKEPFEGVYMFYQPAILVRDPKLIKNILIKDFQHFHDRGVYLDAKNDPMSANLLALPGEEWKALRSKLTPAFTSSKLKGMLPFMKTVGDELVKYLKPMAARSEAIDIRDFAARYIIDCLASITFGQEGISTINNPEHEFRNVGKGLSDNFKFVNVIRAAAVFLCPSLLKILRIRRLPDFMEKFFMNLVTNTINEREKTNVVRKDLIQYLIKLRNTDSNAESKPDTDDWNLNTSPSGKGIKSMTHEEIAAQVFVFYIAGSETSSSTVAYTLYELTQNEEVMARAQEDVRATVEKHNSELTYEAVMDMKFIDLCIKETLRKYPGLPILNRECTKAYPVPGSKFTIEKGTAIVISLLGLHRDGQYFPDPEKYNPDRFTDEHRAFDEDMFMPFGSGPRNCVAYRMGVLLTKVAIAMLLSNYEFTAVSKKELEFDFGTVGLLPKKGDCLITVSEKK